jgi:hypothetical protein
MESNKEIVAIHQEIKDLANKVDRILRTLIGDEDMGQTGLVAKVQKHDDWIEQQKLVWAKVFGIAIGSGIFGGVMTQVVMKLIFK